MVERRTMIDEFTPEIIWVAAIGTIVVFGLMIAVWYMSTRSDAEKKEPSTSYSYTSTMPLSKVIKKKRQYGSPRKKRDITENDLPNVVHVHETITESEVPPSLTSNEVKPKESPLQEKPKSYKGTIKSRSQEAKILTSTDHPLTGHSLSSLSLESTERLSSNRPSNRPQTDRSSADQPSTIDRPVVKKTKVKIKQQQSSGKDDFSAMPGSQIIQAVANSTLSDEEVQLVMEKLLEKQEEEWEATGKGDSIKTLKKTTEDLTARCQDAEKSARLHSQRVKEIGAELKQEKSRSINSEKAYQIKLGKQQEDIDNLKKKVQLYKEEVEMLKSATSDSPQLDINETNRLQEANQAIKNQLSQLTSEKTKATNQVKELADANKQLSLKLTKETEKLSAVQAERNNTHEELVSCRNEIKRLEQDVSTLQVKAQSLHSKLSMTEETLAKEKQDKEDRELLIAGKQEHAISLQELTDKHLLEINELNLQTQLKLEDMKADISHLEAEKNDKEEQISVLNTDNAALKEQMKVLKTELLNVTENFAKVNGQQEVIEENSFPTQNHVMEEEIAELKKENAALQEKVVDLKTKNNVLRDKSWKARDEQEVTLKECNDKLKVREQEHKIQLHQLRLEVNEDHLQQMVFLKKHFPALSDTKESDFKEWISQAEKCVNDKLQEMQEESESKKRSIDEMTKQVEEGSKLTNELKETLSDTLSKLEDLMKKWEEKEKRYNDTILQEELERNQIEEESKNIRERLEKLKVDHNSFKLKCETLEKEKESLSLNHERTLLESQRYAETLRDEKTLKDKVTKEKEQVEARLTQAEVEISDLAEKNETLMKNLAQLNTQLVDYETKLKESEALAESLRNANQDLNHRLQVKFSPPPVATSSDV